MNDGKTVLIMAIIGCALAEVGLFILTGSLEMGLLARSVTSIFLPVGAFFILAASAHG